VTRRYLEKFWAILKGSKDIGNVPDFIEVVSVKELCQGLII
jgi:hypothetical protein